MKFIVETLLEDYIIHYRREHSPFLCSNCSLYRLHSSMSSQTLSAFSCFPKRSSLPVFFCLPSMLYAVQTVSF